MPFHNLTAEDMDSISQFPRFLIAGDFNAKHSHWNSRCLNANGRALWRWQLMNPTVNITSPEDHTSCLLSGGRGDVIDIMITKGIKAENLIVAHALDSDHILIVAELADKRAKLPGSLKKTN
ncbi:hypothetical protein Trydic_g16474 [Trypoxylus dichotomus]